LALKSKVVAVQEIRHSDRTRWRVRVVLGIIDMAERLNVRYAKFGNPGVYENTIFPWAADVESEWRAIREELDNLLVRQDDLPSFQDIAPDVASISTDRGWKTFLLMGYGIKSRRNIALCPETWRILQKIPGLKTAMFSIFEPRKHLPAHRGFCNGVLRFHLGLIVPEPRDQIAIRVGDVICHWEEGRALIFDDAHDHEAWNRTGETRVILFVDFVRPLHFPANLLNWFILHVAIFTPYIREGYDHHRRWERAFHKGG
jgi:aspartyl/asparaginyl beta-hydroxylase (cupin superfamily)